MKKNHLLVTFILGCVVLLVLLVGLPLTQQLRQYKSEKEDYTRYTTPLTVETVKDICFQLGLTEQDNRCKSEAIVYAPEFFTDIKEYLRNLPKEKATQEETDKILGPYLLRCSQPSKLSNGKIYYRCLYDLRGDEVSIISIYFLQDGTIDYIMTTTGSS